MKRTAAPSGGGSAAASGGKQRRVDAPGAPPTAALNATLLYAVKHNIGSLVEAVLPHANINAIDTETGGTPLWIASKDGLFGIVQLLLDTAGVDIEAAPAHTGCGPLIEAAHKGFAPIVRALLDKGALIDAFNETRSTALLFACEERRASTVALLLSYGAGERPPWPLRS